MKDSNPSLLRDSNPFSPLSLPQNTKQNQNQTSQCSVDKTNLFKAKGNLSLSPRIVNSDRQETQVAAPNTKSRIESKVSFENVKSKAFEKATNEPKAAKATIKVVESPPLPLKDAKAKAAKAKAAEQQVNLLQSPSIVNKARFPGFGFLEPPIHANNFSDDVYQNGPFTTTATAPSQSSGQKMPLASKLTFPAVDFILDDNDEKRDPPIPQSCSFDQINM